MSTISADNITSSPKGLNVPGVDMLIHRQQHHDQEIGDQQKQIIENAFSQLPSDSQEVAFDFNSPLCYQWYQELVNKGYNICERYNIQVTLWQYRLTSVPIKEENQDHDPETVFSNYYNVTAVDHDDYERRVELTKVCLEGLVNAKCFCR